MFWPRLGLEPFSAFSLRRLLHLVGTTIKWKVILCILPLLPALAGAVLRVAPVGRRERKQARTWGWPASAIRTVGQRLAQSFPSILLQSDKGSGVHLPCLSVRAPSFLFDFSAVPRGRGAVLHTQTPLGATATLGSLSRDAAPPPAAWGGPGVRPGRRPQAEPEFGYPSQVCTGAIPARSALEGGSCGCAFTAWSSGCAFSGCSPWSSCMESKQWCSLSYRLSMAAAWPRGIVKNISERACCGGETEDERKIRRNQKGAGKLRGRPIASLGLWCVNDSNSSDASFSVCLFYAIDVNNAAPSTPPSFQLLCKKC